jgi:hypothetical protein
MTGRGGGPLRPASLTRSSTLYRPRGRSRPPARHGHLRVLARPGDPSSGRPGTATGPLRILARHGQWCRPHHSSTLATKVSIVTNMGMIRVWCHWPAPGYTAHEPHGYLTGDYPNGGVVTEDRACWLGPRRGTCGFRLWRTPAGYGKPDAGVCVVLCCKAVDPTKGQPPTPGGRLGRVSLSNRTAQTGASRTQQPEA